MRTCRTDSEIMRNEDWRVTFPYRCYFYPGRDCPGWDGGGICGRIGDRIPLDAGRAEDDPRTEPGPCYGQDCDHISHRSAT